MKISSNKIINNIILTLIICFVSFLLILIFTFVPVINEPITRLRNSMYDLAFVVKSKINKKDNNPKTGEVLIVPIDDNTLTIMEEKMGARWPWPRNYYGILSYYLIKQGAKAVVFDILFSSKDFDRIDSNTGEIFIGESNDRYFQKVMLGTNRVVLSFNVEKQKGNNLSLNTIDIENANEFKNVAEYNSLLAVPIDIFQENMNMGYVATEADSDGVIREYTPIAKVGDKYYSSLAVAAYLIAHGKKLPGNLHLNKHGNFKINWYGEGGINKTFKNVFLAQIFSDYSKVRKGMEPVIPAETFKDKVVFVGATARGLVDMKNTPFTKKQAYPGVEIHATAYLNIVNNDWIKTSNPFLEAPVYFIVLLVLVFFGMDNKNPLKYSIVFFAVLVVISAIHFLLFIKFNIMCYTASVITFFFISFLFSQLTNYVTVGRTRNKIKNAFSTYISPDLLNKVTTSNKPLTASGDNISASVLFIDIAGFTTFSEKNPVEKVVEILNLYLQKFSTAIINNHGWVNKYLGDGLMALFGTPAYFDKHQEMAVMSAFECLKINNELAKDYGLNVRIGVNTGNMIFGSFGGGKKLEFTAIGDSINSTSRLEGANKFFSTNILVGESTYKALENEYDLQYLGKVSLKGKAIPYGIYYYNDAEAEYKEKFAEMVAMYEKRDLEGFSGYINFFGSKDFGPALFYINYFNKHKDNFGEPIKLTEK